MSKNEPLYSVAQQPRVEIYQKTDLFSRYPEVCQYLRFEYGVKSLDALNLNDGDILDEQIDPVFTEYPVFVNNWGRELALKLKTRIAKLEARSLFINCFEQPRSEVAVDLNPTPDNPLGYLV